MADLKLDIESVRELGRQLTRISREFHDANSRSDDAADAVGHDGLHDAVRSFAHNWDDTREKMTGDIDKLAKFATAIGDNFQKTDGQLAKSVSGSGEK